MFILACLELSLAKLQRGYKLKVNIRLKKVGMNNHLDGLPANDLMG
jgi:hypothetical protein